MPKKMVFEKSWEMFRKDGMLWFVNRILHVFGWVMVVEINDKNKVINSYPAKTKFRGFDYKFEEKGFRAISNYMIKNAKRLRKECDD